MTQIIIVTIVCITGILVTTVICVALLDVMENLTKKNLDEIRKDLEEHNGKGGERE